MRGTLESLEEENITIDFLRHALIAMRGYIREAQVYDAVQDRVKSETTAVSFASTLERLANSYVATFNPEHEQWNGYPDTIRKSIEVFNLLNIRPFRSLMLAISAEFPEKEAASAFQFLISLGIRLLIASTTRSGSVETPLANAASDVFNERIETAEHLRAELLVIAPNDEAFRSSFEQARVTKAQLARYYLRSLEMAVNDEPEPWFIPMSDRSIINLEHVLPKKPEENWPQFTQDEVGLYTNRLGNQALLRASENSDLKSATFLEKKAIYSQSPYVLTHQIAAYEDWTPASVADRQNQLSKLAIKAWPI